MPEEKSTNTPTDTEKALHAQVDTLDKNIQEVESVIARLKTSNSSLKVDFIKNIETTCGVVSHVPLRLSAGVKSVELTDADHLQNLRTALYNKKKFVLQDVTDRENYRLAPSAPSALTEKPKSFMERIQSFFSSKSTSDEHKKDIPQSTTTNTAVSPVAANASSASTTKPASTEKPKGLMGWLKSLFSSKNTSTEQETKQSISPPTNNTTQKTEATPPSTIQTLQDARNANNLKISAVKKDIAALEAKEAKFVFSEPDVIEHSRLNDLLDELMTKRADILSKIIDAQSPNQNSPTLPDAAVTSSTRHHTTKEPAPIPLQNTQAPAVPAGTLGAQVASNPDVLPTKPQNSAAQFREVVLSLHGQSQQGQNPAPQEPPANRNTPR